MSAEQLEFNVDRIDAKMAELLTYVSACKHHHKLAHARQSSIISTSRPA
jgi:hypothetical protein